MKYARLLLAVGCLLSTAAAQWLETTIQVGEQPYEQLYVPPVNKVYCTSQHDHSVSIIDCATNTVRGTIYAAHFPVAVSYSDVYNRVYIACDSDTTIVIVDAVGDTVIKNLRCDGGPGAAAYCRSLDKLYVLCGGHVDVIDAAGDSMVKRIQVPLYHRAIEWCPTSNLVFFANDRGDSMTVIDCSTDQLRAVHAGSSDFWQIRWNPRDNRVYAVSSWVIHVFNCTGDTLIDSIVLPAYTPASCCFAPYPNKCFVGDYNTGMVYVIDCRMMSITDSVHTGQVCSMVLDSLCGKIYVARAKYGVTVVDARGDSVVTEIPLTQYPSPFIVWSARERRAYLGGYYTDTLYVIRDTALGIAESFKPEAPDRRPEPTILSGASVQRLESKAVFDAMGRRVVNPRSGIFFVRDEGRGAGDAGRMRKVVLQR